MGQVHLIAASSVGEDEGGDYFTWANGASEAASLKYWFEAII